MENTISERVRDFLRQYLPFSLLEAEVLRVVAERVVVRYHKPGTVVFHQGQLPDSHIYIVREGAVHLFREEGSTRQLVDTCDEGDVFGVRPLLAEEAYALTAETKEETLLYAIDVAGFKSVMEQHPKVAYYLASTFAAGVHRSHAEAYRGRLFLQPDTQEASDLSLVEVQGLQPQRDPVCCGPAHSIQAAATIMKDEKVSSIIVVDADKRPLGIVTDKDLRVHAATGAVPLQEPISRIMSAPVKTVGSSLTVADVQMYMIRHRIHHLVVTEDGTSGTPVSGVLTEHDLLVVQGNNPAVLLRRIKRANKAEELGAIRNSAEHLLRKYLYQEVAISFISTVMSSVNDALIQRVIQLSLEEMGADGKPTADFCWLTLGSEGREEQLLRTDQDNALVFEDVPEHQLESTRDWYLKLAGKITQKLNVCGFEYCPADMMGSNPRWCLSLSEWKLQFGKWIHEPAPKAVMHSTIFFDYRPVFGKLELAGALTDFIFENIDNKTTYLNFLAKNALENPPPLTFFRNLVVEKSGEHKDAFDIKARAMMPLADAARVLILSSKVGQINNTFRRFEKLAELEPQNAELYEQAADAYEILMRYRALYGLRHKNSGRYLMPEELTKMERLNLRNSFRPIQDLQSLLKTRFKLAMLM